MIDEVTILLPQQPNVVYGSGDVFTAGGKNVLITGDQGTGKSSLLEAIAISLQRSARFDKHKEMSYQPFPQFVSNSLTKKRAVNKRQGPNQIYERVFHQARRYMHDRSNHTLTRLLHNSFLLPAEPCTAEKLREQLGQLTDLDGKEMLIDGYMAALPRVAEELGEELPRLYGLLHDLNDGSLLRREFPFARFSHAQLTGDLPDTMASMYVQPGKDEMNYHFLPDEHLSEWELIPQYQLEGREKIVGDDGYLVENHYSSGERQLQGLTEVFARNAELIMLDEPISGLDKNHQVELQDRFLSDTSAQYIITSHDLMLNSLLGKSDNWVEWDLNAHVPSLSSVSQVGLPLPSFAIPEYVRIKRAPGEEIPF